MRHYGDICKISGRDVPVVNVIIGGFPLIWEFLNGKGAAVWCSEIEEFPIAVTKLRFPEDDSNEI